MRMVRIGLFPLVRKIGSKVKDLIKLKKLEKQNLEIHDLERELSDGDIIDFEKGF